MCRHVSCIYGQIKILKKTRQLPPPIVEYFQVFIFSCFGLPKLLIVSVNAIEFLTSGPGGENFINSFSTLKLV